jgi:hypothetical protein
MSKNQIQIKNMITTMKHKSILVCFLMLLCLSSNAQTWQGQVTHNGYSCYSLTTADNIKVYAAKGVDGYMGTALFIKIKVPYNWGNTSTACVKYFKENLVTGETDAQASFFNYKNGYLYFVEYLTDWCSTNDRRGNYACNNYSITLYEKNDHGNSGGRKAVVNLHFEKLNANNMPMNKMAFETYW